jgi:hypothetical protein
LRRYFVRFHWLPKTNSTFRAVFYWKSHKIWYVLIFEQLVYELNCFTISESPEVRSHDLWVGRLDRWPSCSPADSFNDAKVQQKMKKQTLMNFIHIGDESSRHPAAMLCSCGVKFIFLSSFLKKSGNSLWWILTIPKKKEWKLIDIG